MKIDKTEVYGFESAIRGARNPMNSWSKSDSYWSLISTHIPNNLHKIQTPCNYIIGKNDLKLMQKLILAGNEHGKFLRQIQVWADFDMPRYWWSEMDTYHFNSKNSCSTMHKLLNKQNPISLDMFTYCEEDKELLLIIIDRLNEIREQFINADNQKTKDCLLIRAKRLLPEGLLQLRTMNTNYAEIRNIWLQRVNIPHKLKEEWVDTFGEWIKTLPYANELIMIKKDN